MSIVDLLAGDLLLPRTGAHYEGTPDDFAVDEETVVEDSPRKAGVKLVKQIGAKSARNFSFVPSKR